VQETRVAFPDPAQRGNPCPRTGKSFPAGRRPDFCFSTLPSKGNPASPAGPPAERRVRAAAVCSGRWSRIPGRTKPTGHPCAVTLNPAGQVYARLNHLLQKAAEATK